MREILFRGKRVDNGKWVKGDLLTNGVDFKCAIRIHGANENGSSDLVSVVPETVGQFTGLTDKNGKKIFEGDICGCFCNTQIFEVKYCKDRFGYFFDDCILSAGCEPSPECLGNLRNTIEVIGNIYDNPELLGEAS